MNRSIALLTALTLLGSAAAARAQQAGTVAVHLAAPDQPAPLLRVHERLGRAAPAPTKLDGLVFLPLDANGRTRVGALLPDAVRRVDDLPGASRLVLPGIGGSLYRYRRAVPAGGLRFGLLHAAAGGALRVLLERAGSGPAGADDPLLPRVGVAADGATLLAATTAAAGGDLLEVEVSSGVVRSHSAALAPLQIDATSLTVGAGFALATCDLGLVRCATGVASELEVISFGPFDAQPPTWYGAEVVLSPSRTQAATVAGAAPKSAHLYVVGAAGAARRATQVPGALSRAGFLPEFAHGPFFAVDDAGARAAWRQETVDPLDPTKTSREAFLRDVGAPATEPAVQFTADAFFIDTLDEVGVITMAGIGAALMTVGELGTDPGQPIEAADVFKVTLDALGQPVFENLSGTSGVTQAPFLQPGTLTPEGLFRAPQGSRLLVYDTGSGAADRLLAVSTDQPGLSVLLGQTRELDFVVSAGPWVALGVERDTPQRPREILRLPADLGAPATVLESALDREYARAVARPDGRVAFVTLLANGGELIQRLDLAGGPVETFPGGPDQYGEVLALTPSGALCFTRELPAGPRFLVWPFDAAAGLELPLAPAAGHLVPGR